MDLKTICSTFQNCGFDVFGFETKEEAKQFLNKEIDGVSVAFGGSVTAAALDLPALLGTHNQVLHHWSMPAGMTREELFRAAAQTDVYITSANGVAETGALVNIDGFGNRVASTLFGHKTVYYVIGANKLAPTLEDAIFRARNIAAPQNAKRLGKKTPCAVKGDRCYDCSSPERICNGVVIQYRPMFSCRCVLVFVNEPLGL